MVRAWLGGLLLLLTPVWAVGAEPFTARDLAEGWVQLWDGETTFGWETSQGVAASKEGLVLKKDQEISTIVPIAGELAFSFAPKSAIVAFELEPIGSKQEPFLFSLMPRNEVVKVSLKGELTKNNEWQITGAGQPVAWKASTRFVKLTIACTDSATLTKAWWRPTTAASIFDGKTLTGWKVYGGDAKKAASKFEATTNGELRVTNGPGDLQTEAKYGDFCLQFECKTQGTALNSGIFFRCLPDQYQAGYEAQIQNAFKDNDRTKPVDFGTGAIYRRIAARRVVSNDNQWFHMTVMPIGARLRTWVNGYPVVDWKDDRPVDENARKGLRTAPGHLSIQGHDPTTDILFRKLRVASFDVP
jgi:Domain of Unknown Function (DUF1080)